MNRRLLRETYHLEAEDAHFTHGIPAHLKEVLSGDSASATWNYTHAFGSHYALFPRGLCGQGGILSGSPLSTGVVKVFEMEATGISASGAVRVGLGLASETGDAVLLDVVPGDAEIDSAGSAYLSLRAGDERQETPLFKPGSATMISELDLGIFIDCEKRSAQAHVGYTYIEARDAGFPVGKILYPVLRGMLLTDGHLPEIRVRRLRWTVYV